MDECLFDECEVEDLPKQEEMKKSKDKKKKSKKKMEREMDARECLDDEEQSTAISGYELKDLVSHQNIDGSFNPDYFKAHSTLKSAIANLPAGINEIVWATALALAVLEKYLKVREGEWKLIANKAKSYLKKQKVGDVKALISEAVGLI